MTQGQASPIFRQGELEEVWEWAVYIWLSVVAKAVKCPKR